MRPRTALIMLMVSLCSFAGMALAFSAWPELGPGTQENLPNLVMMVLMVTGFGPLLPVYIMAPDILNRMEVPAKCPGCGFRRLSHREFVDPPSLGHARSRMMKRVHCGRCGWEKSHVSAWDGHPSIGDY